VDDYTQVEGRRFTLVKEAVIDPELFKDRFPLRKGESNKHRERGKNKVINLTTLPRLEITPISSSISDINILNCNKKYLAIL